MRQMTKGVENQIRIFVISRVGDGLDIALSFLVQPIFQPMSSCVGVSLHPHCSATGVSHPCLGLAEIAWSEAASDKRFFRPPVVSFV
jgi:hypothetical protein